MKRYYILLLLAIVLLPTLCTAYTQNITNVTYFYSLRFSNPGNALDGNWSSYAIENNTGSFWDSGIYATYFENTDTTRDMYAMDIYAKYGNGSIWFRSYNSSCIKNQKISFTVTLMNWTEDWCREGIEDCYRRITFSNSECGLNIYQNFTDNVSNNRLYEIAYVGYFNEIVVPVLPNDQCTSAKMALFSAFSIIALALIIFSAYLLYTAEDFDISNVVLLISMAVILMMSFVIIYYIANATCYF